MLRTGQISLELILTLNRQWQDTAVKEVAAPINHKFFDLKSPNFKLSKEYQKCRLHIVYDVEPNLIHKARLVYGGSRVDPRALL